MRIIRLFFLILVTLLSLFVSATGFAAQIDATSRILHILFLPVTAYLIYILIEHLTGNTPIFDQKTGFKRMLAYYSFIITTAVVIISLLSSTTPAEIVSSVIFSPMAIYFLILVWPRYRNALSTAKGRVTTAKEPEIKEVLPATAKMDVDRRDFIKLIGSAGILALVLGLFGRRGGISSLLGTGGLESVTLKDISGNVISPAQSSPTDGYSIAQIDDSVPAYFGFIDKHGAWFIMKEGEDDSFRYVRGSGDFSSSWNSRAGLKYDFFNKVF